MTSQPEQRPIIENDLGDVEGLKVEILGEAGKLCTNIGLKLEIDRSESDKLVLIFYSGARLTARCVFNFSKNPPAGQAITFEPFGEKGFKVVSYNENLTNWRKFLPIYINSLSSSEPVGRRSRYVEIRPSEAIGKPEQALRVGLGTPERELNKFINALKVDQKKIFSILLHHWTGKRNGIYRRLEGDGLGADVKHYDYDALYHQLYSELTAYRRGQLEQFKNYYSLK